MAGYVFAIGGNSNAEEIIKECAERGVYSTYLNSISPIPFQGTMADYLSMKPGDNIYFFCKRKFYGIGELVSVGPDCKYCNFPKASERRVFEYNEISESFLLDKGKDSTQYRWICTFKGSPYFFKDGIDTDEILSYKPNTFKIIRAFWKVSFIKLGEEENQSLKELFLLRHQHELSSGENIFTESSLLHEKIKKHPLEKYIITPFDMLRTSSTDEKVKHEMALEATVIYDLDKGNIVDLGKWDYISHQVIASPFKPIDYMDKIDVFAINYLRNSKIPCKYLVAELKKELADCETIDQVLKYVDWVCSEYAYGDYSLVQACIIAFDYKENVYPYYKEVVKRFYTLGSHPVRNKRWDSLRLIKYQYKDNKVHYQDITPTITSN